MDQKVLSMGRKAMCRRFFVRFQEGVREQCIDVANQKHALRQYRTYCCKRIMQVLRVATHRACLIRKAYERQCKVWTRTFLIFLPVCIEY